MSEQANSRHSRSPMWYGCYLPMTAIAVTFMVALGLAVLFTRWIFPPARVFEDLTLQDAREMSLGIELPDQSSHINVREERRIGDVTFVIDFSLCEQAFLDWAREQKWELKRIPEDYPRGGFDYGIYSIRFSEGYEYSTIGRGERSTMCVLYDKARERAYFFFWSAPWIEN